ncbi:MAG TPA: HlyD family efflux transporter periplasmic adaptor subunit [Verrucomicrobiales bacterium]|nr:HlyD family efflux transporter periplasmic adaptor subunit [Verrucomicrobiales bacterium]
MSEFHPNRLQPVKTRLGVTKRRILESWPILVWGGVLVVAIWTYRSGVVFTRMNGAVDVDHQYVSSAEDGKVLKILVKEGDTVQPNGVVAEMDSRALKHEMQALIQGIAASRHEDILQLERTRISLQSELRGYAITQAEDKGKLATLKKTLGSEKVFKTDSGKILSNMDPEDLDKVNVDIAEAAARQEELPNTIKSVQADFERVDALIKKIQADIKYAENAISGEITPELLAALNASERSDLMEVKAKIDGCLLRAPKGGVVEKVDKLEGAFAAAGESIVQVVADPGRIVAFLPQDQLGKVKEGTKVWITPSHSREAIYESTVTSIGSRVTSVADVTSNMRNSRVYGRNLTIAFPAELRQSGESAPLFLGETVIIHTRPPGEIPLIERLFHSDAPDA